ncbi:MAG: restriction endonuclease subunit S [Saprospiraceae bacterium]|jgi:type I restriction enzyme S subunit|nr:restriction endonuclease subunit S [Saprospiraceae bacterium]MBK7794926.1 restriction endonuclease subunit S [Saprospiraceae bacterium]MBL0262183.1 restriction endonuclease subunit S [Saprospiraceae bacterium]
MSKINENKLVPKLRFSDFAGEWEKDELGNLIEIKGRIGYRGYTVNDIVGIGEGAISLSPSNISDNNLLQFEKSTYITWEKYNESPEIQLKDGYTVLVKTGSSYGKAALIKNLPEKSTINPQLVVLKPNKIDKRFLFYIVSNAPVQKQIEASVVGGAIPTLSQESISKFEVLIPPDKDKSEQKKIAACLSSLDEVITAESQKLEVLKEHKKGLLQNLFPQSRLNRDLSDEMMSMMGTKKNQGNQENQKNQGSDNVPKVRSKEFEDSGEWMETTLGEIGEPLMCKRIFKEETTPNPNNGVPFYKIGTFGRSADAYISKEIYEEYKSKYSFPRIGDILISASGTIGRLVIYDGSPAYFQDSNIIWLGHYEDAVLNRFLLYCYSNLTWQTSDGGVISRLYNSDFKRMKIKYPDNKEEQQKIASCLSSIDELIIAQTQKIEALQLHKKGLLQGLFPNLNEVTE